MMRLADFQKRFLGSVLDDESAAGARAVYRRHILANLHDALAAAYPVVRRLVGDAFFREAADRHAHAHPSASGDLHRYGGEFARFLASYEPARDLRYLPDIARLEWAVAQAYHAGDTRTIDYPALSAIPEERRQHLRLRFQPAARLIESSHPVGAIWEANQPERDGTPDRVEGPDRVLVHRDHFQVRVHTLAGRDWKFLAAAERGATLGEMAQDPEIGSELPAHLVQWTRARVIDGFIGGDR